MYKVPRGIFRGTDRGRDEAAARIVYLALAHKEWVEFSLEMLENVMHGDMEMYRAHKEIERVNLEAQKSFNRKLFWDKILCVVTLGIYSLLTTKPKAIKLLQVAGKLPSSIIFSEEERLVRDGIHTLEKDGLLKKDFKYGDGKIRRGMSEVFYPTLKFFEAFAHLIED